MSMWNGCVGIIVKGLDLNKNMKFLERKPSYTTCPYRPCWHFQHFLDWQAKSYFSNFVCTEISISLKILRFFASSFWMGPRFKAASSITLTSYVGLFLMTPWRYPAFKQFLQRTLTQAHLPQVILDAQVVNPAIRNLFGYQNKSKSEIFNSETN